MKGRIVGSGVKTKYYLNNEEVSAECFNEVFPDKPMSKDGQCSLVGWSRPILSDAMAVHPSQITQVMERNRRHDLHIDYNAEDGRPVLTSREQRKRLMKIEGFHDNNGGFGDDTGNTMSKPPDTDFSHLDNI